MQVEPNHQMKNCRLDEFWLAIACVCTRVYDEMMQLQQHEQIKENLMVTYRPQPLNLKEKPYLCKTNTRI